MDDALNIEPDRLGITACMMTPPARVVEPRLTPGSTRCGAILLIERDLAHVVWKGIGEAVDAWIGGRRLLRQGCILMPFQRIPDRFVHRFGDDYREGSFLRLSAPTPPPIFANSGEVMDAAEVRPGSLVECAVHFVAGVRQTQRAVRAVLEWMEVRSVPPRVDPAWVTVF